MIGSGAIGGVLAEAARDAGHDVVLCVRTPFEQLVVDAPDGPRNVPAEIATDPAAVGPVDWVLLTTKVQDVPSTEPWLAALAGSSTPIAVVQNGVQHRESVADPAPGGPVLPALIYVAAERVRPGRVLRRSSASVLVESGPLGERFTELLGGSGLEMSRTGDFRTAAWRKMLTNLGANPITALTLRRLEVFDEPDVVQLCDGVLAEAVQVARAEGADLTQQDADRVLANYTHDFPPSNGTSMLYDRLAGLPTEHEHITGALVRAADRHGIEVPLNRTLLALLRALRPTALPQV